MSAIKENMTEVRQNIVSACERSCRNIEDVTLIAVSKTKPVEMLREAYEAGVPHSMGIITGERKLNGGVLLFNAKKIRQEKLQEVFIATRLSLGERKSMDQETFHMVFGDGKVFLKPQYNVMIDKVDYEKKYY